MTKIELIENKIHFQEILKKLKYDQQMNQNMVPPKQRYSLITDFGPGQEYPIQFSRYAIKFWGAFMTIEECKLHQEELIKNYPYMKSIGFKIVENSEFIVLCDTLSKEELQKIYQKTMEDHIQKEKDGLLSAEQRRDGAYKFHIEQQKEVEILKKQIDDLHSNKDYSKEREENLKFIEELPEWKPSDTSSGFAGQSVEKQCSICPKVNIALTKQMLITQTFGINPELYEIRRKKIDDKSFAIIQKYL